MSGKKKLVGVVLISIYSAFIALFWLFVGSILLLFSALEISSIPEINFILERTAWVLEKPAWVVTLTSMIRILNGVVWLASAYGLWTLQHWGRDLILWLYAINMLGDVLAIFISYSESTVGYTVLPLCDLGVAIFILMYITKSETKALFNGNRVYANKAFKSDS